MDKVDIEFMEAQKLTFDCIIGGGGYGYVFKVYSLKYSQSFALKRIEENRFNPNEVECMKMISSNTIVPLYGYCKYEGRVYLIMEHCSYSLDRVIPNYNMIDSNTLISYIKGMITALNSCHVESIAHCDVKPSNFLIDKYGRIKLCDFGLAKCMLKDEKISAFHGTLAFLAPEIIKKEPYDPFKADIWALGVSIYFMSTGHLPWPMANKMDTIHAIEEGVYDITAVPMKLRNIVVRCCLVDPHMRPTCVDLLKMAPFVKQRIQLNTKFYQRIKKRSSLNEFLPQRIKTTIVRPSPITQDV